jgi:hypothetical protein
MGLYLGANVLHDNKSFAVPKLTTAGRPVSPTVGQIIFNTTTNKLESWNGTEWIAVTDDNRPFLYRTVITTSYVAGGYKDGNPWRNANRMVHATDVTTNLGDLLTVPAAYVSGACNLTKGFIWGASTSHPGSSTQTVAINMATETSAGSVSDWNLRQARDDAGTVWKETEFAYIIGAGTDGFIDVFNLTTESMYRSNTGASSLTGYCGSFNDERAGYVWSETAAQKIIYSTTVSYSVSDSRVRAAHDQQKGINSKVGRGWCGNEGTYNGGYNLRRWEFTTDTNLGTVSKPIGNSGEENFDMGQAHQYMMGMYDGAQNNRGWKFTYSTDSGFELGAGSIRTGITGSSSGHCFWKG